MAKIAYVPKRFGKDTKSIIDKANALIESYDGQGLSLTLRQLYYRLVSADVIPNTLRSYKNLGWIISGARLAGLIDWDAIIDRERPLRGINSYDSASQCMRSAAASFYLDRHEGQPRHIEVWVEKNALVDVIGKACMDYHVDYFSCKGYTSQTGLHEAALRLKEKSKIGQDPLIIHLGDHDPSGKDMTHDIERRFEMFGVTVEVDRIALNMDQIKKYKPPPNPAKPTDSRYQGYKDEFGVKCWELDALEPNVIIKLIQDRIKKEIDKPAWDARLAEEKSQRESIYDAAEGLEAAEPVEKEPKTLPELRKNLVSIKRLIRERKKKEAKQKREDKRRKERQRKELAKAKAKAKRDRARKAKK